MWQRSLSDFVVHLRVKRVFARTVTSNTSSKASSTFIDSEDTDFFSHSGQGHGYMRDDVRFSTGGAPLVYRSSLAGVHRMPADGNCMFHSLAFPTNSSGELRQRVVDYIEAHWDDFCGFMTRAEKDTYCERMRRLGTWGDEIVLQAFSEMDQHTVQVFDAPTGRLIQTYRPTISTGVKRLLYDGLHYDVRVP